MTGFSVSLTAPHELLSALRVLFDRRPDRDGPERYRDAIASGAHEPTAVFVAREAGRVAGAALVQALPGALGVTWPPRAPTPEAEDALTRAASDWLKERGVKVCQAFASADELPGMAPLTRNGFRHVTQLVSMRRELSDSPPIPGAGYPMRFVSAEMMRDAAFAEQFTATLLATHEGTLDCPELNGTRTAAELALEVAEAGEHYLAYNLTVPGTPVGVVSLTGNAEPGAVELSYLGVVPPERSRGYGRALLAFAAEAARSRAAALALSVDARNEPALRLYYRHGFVETERREVFLAVFPDERGV
jgi:ribosomal protein S18 acetylase RimI-like enzyme